MTFFRKNDNINLYPVYKIPVSYTHLKAGALDGLEGNRRQKMMIYGSLLDALNQEKKTTMAGQMTLFDIAPEEDKAEYEIKLPNVEEYDKEVLLGFEKEVLGIYRCV